MNTVWSSFIQSINTLYLTRQLRFSDAFENELKKSFNIEGKKSILELGCGPGALSMALKRWYKNAEVCGTDRDSNFIEFAKHNSTGITFLEEDATNLSFKDETFDVTISNTVQEHIEPAKFFGEQYRVLKKGGVCLSLTTSKSITHVAPCIAKQTPFETKIFKKTKSYFAEIDKKYNVCAYAQNEQQSPINMEKYGFKNVSVSYVTLNLTPDNPNVSRAQAIAMIDANRKIEIEGVKSLLNVAPNVVSQKDVDKLIKIKNKKYDKRVELYNAGKKQWDTNVSVVMILRGEK